MTSTTSAVLNSVDYFIIFVFCLSMLAGYIRGFVKEIVSLITWAAASILATLFSGKLAAAFSGVSAKAVNGIADSIGSGSGNSMAGSISTLSIGASFVAIFIATLFIGYIVGTLVTGVTQGAGESLTNRFLGALFGGVRGFIVVIVLMFIAELTPMAAQPAWAQSQFVKSFQPVVTWADKIVQPGLDSLRAKAASAVQGIGSQLPDVSGAISGAFSGTGQ